MNMNEWFEKNKLIFIDVFLYTLNILIVVLSAWAIDLHRYGLDITISRYIGLRRWTAIMYLIFAGVMATLAVIHLSKIRMNVVKKIFYILVCVCIFGCGVFPTNRNWNVVSSNIHDIFSHTSMVCGTITFIWTLVKPLNKTQRIFGIIAIAYAIFFIAYFEFLKWDFLFHTLFIWENVFVYLFMAELCVETIPPAKPASQ